jgi:hypothetical protein
MQRMVLTTGVADDTAVSIGDMKIRRCRGCAKCMYENPGNCILDDDFSPMIPELLSCEELTIRSTVDDHWFSMPMRKVVERIGNILEAWTDSGNNVPRDDSEITLRNIIIVTSGPADDMFESSSREVLEKGPVKIAFVYE